MDYELIATHGVLQRLLSELANGADPWEAVFSTHFWTPSPLVTIADVDRARAVCKSWKAIVDASPEYATIRLARWDYSQLEGANWVSKAEFETQRFNWSWSIFNTSWNMGIPFSDRRFREEPLSALTNSELSHLRDRLSGSGNSPIPTFEGQKLSPRFDIWVAPSARA